MKYIVYLTTNKINNKIYIGVHKTEIVEFDDYLGCGAFANSPKTYNKGKTPFHSAILKYGPKNFYRTTLKEFDNKSDALSLERDLVNEDFIKRVDTYNIYLGGGDPPLLSKKIYQYDINGNFIKKWDSIKSITTFYNCNKDRITMVIHDRRSFKNCFWSYEHLDNIDLSNYRISFHEGTIKQFSKYGVLLNEFNSLEDISIKLDVDKRRVSNAICDGRLLMDCFFTKNDDIDILMANKNNRQLNLKKKIYRYSIDGIFEKEYDTMESAMKELKIKFSLMSRSLKNNGIIKGYRWSFDKKEKLDVKSKNIKATPIDQYSINGEFVKSWNTMYECRKEFPSLLKVLKGDIKQTKGFVFKYKEVKDIV